MKVELGQVFTKEIISDFMVELLSLDKKALVLEPCAGEGIFIKSLIKQNRYQIEANELDQNYFNKLKKEYNYISIYNNEFLFHDFKKTYDGIVMNPPFIRHEEIDNLRSFGITKDKLSRNSIYKNLSLKSNLYMYFILKAISILNSKGELIVIFPSSWLNSSIGISFRKEIEKYINIEEIIHIVGNPYEDKVIADSIIMKCKKDSTDNLKVKKLIIENNKLKLKVKQSNIYDFSKWVQFNKYADVRRGIGTGYNKGFINPKLDSNKDLNILPDILSSPKNLKGFNTNKAKTDKLLYLSDEKNLYIPNSILKYKDKLRKTILKEMRPKTIYNKIIMDKEWDNINVFDCSGIIFSYIIRKNCKFILNNNIEFVRDNFYIITPKINVYIMMALLNNYYVYLQLEDIGKKYGNGMLKIQVSDFDSLKLPNLSKISKRDVEKLEILGKDISNNKTDAIDLITEILSKYSVLESNLVKKTYTDYIEKRMVE